MKTQILAAVDGGDGEACECALSPVELGERIQQWKSLSRQSLSRTSLPGSVVSTYPRDPQILEQLRELIEAESACCPFLSFQVREGGDVIEVELQYPPEFEPLVSLVVPAAGTSV